VSHRYDFVSASGCCEGRQDLVLPSLLHSEIEHLFRRDDAFDLRKKYFFADVLLVKRELGFRSGRTWHSLFDNNLGNDLRHGDGSRTVSLDSLAGIVSRLWELLKLSARGMLAIGKRQKQW
jgi:hypothetical protein